MKSAVARLHATGMLQTTATRSRALTSGSCGCGSSGSQKNTSRSEFNKVSRDAGLADLRDWLVLALISGDGTPRTQLEIATQLGIDKSTLVPLLDRLERDGLIIRSTSERDRRVRIPQATPAGIKVVKEVAIARDAAINDRLAAIPPAERASFHATLWKIVEGAATRQ